MKKITNLVPCWRTGALACAVALALVGCGGGATDGGLSNGPQMAAATTDVPVESTAAATEPAAAEPAPAEPAVAVADPVPAAPGAAGAGAQPAAQADSFAMTGYGSSMTRQPASTAQGASQGAAQPATAGQAAAAPADAGTGAPGQAAVVDTSTAGDPAAQASAVPVPDGANRSYGPSGAGFPAADTEPEMCKYGGCSFR